MFVFLLKVKATYGKKPNPQLSVSLTHCCPQYKSKTWHLNFLLEFRSIVCLSPVHLLGIPHATPPKLLVVVPFGGGRIQAGKQLGDSGELATLPGAQRVPRPPSLVWAFVAANIQNLLLHSSSFRRGKQLLPVQFVCAARDMRSSQSTGENRSVFSPK